jgi:hypothetical protein
MTAERLNEIKALKDSAQKKMKGKSFKNLSSSDKDLLLEAVCKLLGLIS